MESRYIIELKPSDFQNGKITHPKLDGKNGMVAFSAKWCGHCQRMKGPYTKTASILGESFPMFNVDCVKYGDFASSLGVQGYPTIKYINRFGRITKDFTADRSVDGFLDDICKEAKTCSKR